MHWEQQLREVAYTTQTEEGELHHALTGLPVGAGGLILACAFNYAMQSPPADSAPGQAMVSWCAPTELVVHKPGCESLISRVDRDFTDVRPLASPAGPVSDSQLETALLALGYRFDLCAPCTGAHCPIYKVTATALTQLGTVADVVGVAACEIFQLALVRQAKLDTAFMSASASLGERIMRASCASMARSCVDAIMRLRVASAYDEWEDLAHQATQLITAIEVATVRDGEMPVRGDTAADRRRVYDGEGTWWWAPLIGSGVLFYEHRLARSGITSLESAHLALTVREVDMVAQRAHSGA